MQMIIDRLALCCLVPSPPSASDVQFKPRVLETETPPTVAPNEIFCLAPNHPLRVQIGGTCAGNAVAEAIEIGMFQLGFVLEPVSGTGCWAQGQLFTAVEHGHTDASSGAFVQRVLEAAQVWGWPTRTDHPEEGLQELNAKALGEIVTRAGRVAKLQHEVIRGGLFGLGNPCNNAEEALRDGKVLVTSGLVDEAFAKAPAGGVIVPPYGGGGHALAIDSVWYENGQRIWGILDTWGRGMEETGVLKRRLHGTDDWMKSRWEIRATQMVLV